MSLLWSGGQWGRVLRENAHLLGRSGCVCVCVCVGGRGEGNPTSYRTVIGSAVHLWEGGVRGGPV